MTSHRRSRSAGEQAEPIVKAIADLIDREHFRARGGELDRQRNAVEAPADLGDSCGVRGCELEIPDDSLRPIDEQLDGLEFSDDRRSAGDVCARLEPRGTAAGTAARRRSPALRGW